MDLESAAACALHVFNMRDREAGLFSNDVVRNPWIWGALGSANFLKANIMRIVVTNDDGIYSPGIAALARTAQKFGEVRVIARTSKCRLPASRSALRGR